MVSTKNGRYIFIAILLLAFFKTHAQNIDERTYLHKMRLIDSLSFYKVDNYDTLYRISTSTNFGGTAYKENHYGWIDEQNEKSILLLNINGQKSIFDRKDITNIKPLPLNQETIDSLNSREIERFADDMRSFARNYEFISWLYKKGKYDYSKQLIPKTPYFFADTNIRNGFGALYYNAMLSAYSYERDYKKAITFGEHLSGSVFKGYEYQNEAIALTKQLKDKPEDFKTFRLPDSLEWGALKQKLNRKEQLLYLADRLRLLNCIQLSQPGGISYAMYQYSIPYFSSTALNVSYWKPSTKYSVINPFNELIMIKLTLTEAELLLPYLLTDTYIPSYNYHRDFFPERNLHKLSWVAESLIFEITHKNFFDRFKFDMLTNSQKEAEIQKIKKWCDENASLSPEALTTKELETANNWSDFYAALQTARQQKNDSLLPIMVKRFNDFNKRGWPSNRGIMSQTMFETGGEKYTYAVRKWNRDTSDKWVALWTSMFLIKYDRESYVPAMAELETVLKECDGTTYYPHAMDLLLSMNDKRAFKLGEDILDKDGFQRLMDWDYYEGFIKKLLLAKSDHAFNLLRSKLDAYTLDRMNASHKDNDHMSTQDDTYVLVVDKLRNDGSPYYDIKTNAERVAYIKILGKWFKTQYALLKEGKPNELHLDVKPVNAPVTFVDTYYK